MTTSLLQFPLGKRRTITPRSTTFLARVDHVLLSAAYHGVIKRDPQKMQTLLRAVLHQDPKIMVEVSEEEALMIESASYQDLYYQLFTHKEDR